MKRILKVLAALVAVGVLAAGGGWLWLQARLDTPAQAGGAQAAPVEFVVPRGASARALGPLLEKEGLITDARLWRLYLWQQGGVSLKAGRFHLRPTMTLAEIATTLSGAPLPEDSPFTFVEGWRLRDTDAALAAKGLIKPGEWIRAATGPQNFTAPFPLPKDTLEGYLYPETYRFVQDEVDVHALIQAQLDTFTQRFWEPHKDEIQKSGRTLHQLVIMASMLEREEPVPDQRPLVAGILWKRFDSKTALGVDATSRYELAEWNDRKAFLKRLRDPDDAYNTRTRAGLPPTPIGAPTVSSLVAALRPTPSKYWYYLHDADKVLHPSVNAAEHEAKRHKYNVW